MRAKLHVRSFAVVAILLAGPWRLPLHAGLLEVPQRGFLSSRQHRCVPDWSRRWHAGRRTVRRSTGNSGCPAAEEAQQALHVESHMLPRRHALQLSTALAWPCLPSRAASDARIPTYKLNDGVDMPVIGLGTYRVPPGQQTYEVVRTALKLGYRMIDTAEAYANEADVGRACRDSGIPRQELFVATKLLDTDHGYRQALRAGRKSVEQLGLGYADLFLIHSPGVFSPMGGNIVETYDALLQLQREGVVRSVGVSNFGVAHLEALRAAGRPSPAVNQFELHPLVFQERADVVDYCRQHAILVQAYGSILSGRDGLLPKQAQDAATTHGKTPAQVMLRWALDQGFQVIPKSLRAGRLAENFDVLDFALTPSEVQELNAVGSGRIPEEYWGGVDPLTQVPVSLGNVGLKTEDPTEVSGWARSLLLDAFSDASHAVVNTVVRSRQD